jgi:hypothetical protein
VTQMKKTSIFLASLTLMVSINSFAAGETTCIATCLNSTLGGFNTESVVSYGSNPAEALDKLKKACDAKLGSDSVIASKFDLKKQNFEFNFNDACTSMAPACR